MEINRRTLFKIFGAAPLAAIGVEQLIAKINLPPIKPKDNQSDADTVYTHGIWNLIISGVEYPLTSITTNQTKEYIDITSIDDAPYHRHFIENPLTNTGIEVSIPFTKDIQHLMKNLDDWYLLGEFTKLMIRCKDPAAPSFSFTGMPTKIVSDPRNFEQTIDVHITIAITSEIYWED